MKLMPRRGEMQEEAKEKKKRTKGDIASLVILIVLAVILVPIFAINLTLIIKGSIDPDVPPDVFGVAPMAVTTGSMDGDEADSFAEGALIFVRILDEEEKQALQEGDIVTFRTNGAYVTHRIVTVNTVDGAVVSVTTKGDANSANDGAILLENVVGLCTGSVAGMGSFAMFLQTPVGIVVVIGIPVLLYIAYDVTRITLNNRRIRRRKPPDRRRRRAKRTRRSAVCANCLRKKTGQRSRPKAKKVRNGLLIAVKKRRRMARSSVRRRARPKAIRPKGRKKAPRPQKNDPARRAAKKGQTAMAVLSCQKTR